MSTYLDIAKQAEALLLATVMPAACDREEEFRPLPALPLPPALPAAVPVSVERSYRQWVTGNIPQTATIPLAEPLAPPKYHDRPSPCKTYVGRPCEKKACQGHRTRFAPSGLCTSCWERAKKVTTMSETPE
jgi:hypothetical protein